jgi:nicotinamide mononucleotide transporter
MTNIHNLLPSLFSEPASYPFLDAFTTVMSFAAQLLMAHKRLESWVLWIVVDVIGIGLYWEKDVAFIALLYAVFLLLACRGLYDWWAAQRGTGSERTASLLRSVT